MSWEAIVAQRRWLLKLGAACFTAAVVTGVLGFFTSSVGAAPVIFALLGAQALGAAPLLQRIADLQAAADMRRMHEEASTPAGLIVIRPGEIHEFKYLPAAGGGKLRVRAHTTSKLEVLP